MQKIVKIVERDDIELFQMMGVTKQEVKNMRF
jgi:vacuolar-type H+-ATPase subunit F/Vma7